MYGVFINRLLLKTIYEIFQEMEIELIIAIQRFLNEKYGIRAVYGATKFYCPQLTTIPKNANFIVYHEKQQRRGLETYLALPDSITVDGRTFKLKEGSKYEFSSMTYHPTDLTVSFDIIFVEKKFKSVVIDGVLVVASEDLLEIYKSYRFFTEPLEKTITALTLYNQVSNLAYNFKETSAACGSSFGTPLPLGTPVQSLCFDTSPTQKGDKENTHPKCLPLRRLSF